MLQEYDSPARHYCTEEDLPAKITVPPFSRKGAGSGKAVAPAASKKKISKSGVKLNTKVGEDALTPDDFPDFDMRDTMDGSLEKSKQGRDALQHKNASEERGGERKRGRDSDLDDNAKEGNDALQNPKDTDERGAEARSHGRTHSQSSSNRRSGLDKDRRSGRSHSDSRGRDRDQNRSRDRDQNRSRDRDQSRSRDRDQSRSRDLDQSRSRDRDRSRSRDRDQSRSRDRDQNRSPDRDQNRSRDRHQRSSRNRSRSRDRDSGSKRHRRHCAPHSSPEHTPLRQLRSHTRLLFMKLS